MVYECMVMQFPVIWHGDNVIPDSSAISEYLVRTYPAQMAALQPPDAQRCASGVCFPSYTPCLRVGCFNFHNHCWSCAWVCAALQHRQQRFE